MNLYEMTDQYANLLEMVEENPYSESLLEMLEGMSGKWDDKVDAVLSFRNSYRADAKALREEAKRLEDRARSAENQANNLEIMVGIALEKIGVDKMKTLKFTTWMQLNPPALQVGDEKQIPPYYFIPQPGRLDRDKLKEDIKNGVYNRPEIAKLHQTKSLRVR